MIELINRILLMSKAWLRAASFTLTTRSGNDATGKTTRGYNTVNKTIQEQASFSKCIEAAT